MSRTPKSCEIIVLFAELRPDVLERFYCVFASPVAPFGYGWPGFERDKPAGKRGNLWTCTDHRDDGEQRLQAAIAAFYGRTGPHKKITLMINPVKGPLQ